MTTANKQIYFYIQITWYQGIYTKPKVDIMKVYLKNETK
jgi:hypothetical protein